MPLGKGQAFSGFCSSHTQQVLLVRIVEVGGSYQEQDIVQQQRGSRNVQ
jgi:hypothetical protein